MAKECSTLGHISGMIFWAIIVLVLFNKYSGYHVGLRSTESGGVAITFTDRQQKTVDLIGTPGSDDSSSTVEEELMPPEPNITEEEPKDEKQEVDPFY